MDTKPPSSPHVLIFPLPMQGHVNSMLKLTELLLTAGLHITFLISAKDHDRLFRYTTVHGHLNSYSGFRFHVIHGLYEGPVDTGDKLTILFDSLSKVTTPLLRNMLLDSPVACLIADGIMAFPLDAAKGTGVPVFFFRTVSACAFWAYFCIPDLVTSGDIPFQGTDMDKQIVNVKGMEGFLRQRDLPSFFRSDVNNVTLQQIANVTRRTQESHALILNTFDELEGPILSEIRKYCPNIYTIGPLHAHLKSTSSNNLFEEDKTCIGWLDQQSPKSVLYVSFGSITTLTREQLIEFWHGLVNSGKRFLWVIREDLLLNHGGDNKVPSEVKDVTRERGYIVGWVPQQEVLAHPAISAFLTHNGWNSTLESIVEGVPMVSWPFFADQQINSRFVEAVWKLGLDMKDTCDKTIIAKMIKEVMDVKIEDFTKSANRMAKLARECVSKGGSSYRNLDRLIKDIKEMSVRSTDIQVN
ncbi:7-deoxyloganetic acid glucosyltransferase-like [Cynara cardunculus var. scolymus]|uniref:7-deoxyloganetic acid glucosyltransferase-like n=1 Tax=Cynara cardunculus var. scolymus TaxID=59895 RepID=UPI000D62C013|nr:7-deoxyloganetic acid glucosyltransferase-like [Cynara cardunculus var. scolymus]